MSLIDFKAYEGHQMITGSNKMKSLIYLVILGIAYVHCANIPEPASEKKDAKEKAGSVHQDEELKTFGQLKAEREADSSKTKDDENDPKHPKNVLKSLTGIDLDDLIHPKAMNKPVADHKSHGTDDIWKTNEADGIAEFMDGGDMRLSNKQIYEEITGKNLQGDEVNVQQDATNAWPGRTVPYTLNSNLSPQGRNDILAAIAQFNDQTCLNFVPRTNQADYVDFKDGQGCSSFVGRIGRPGQAITLQQPGCYSRGTILHEMTHAVGFFHEQSRSDRDNFVTINTENIIPRAVFNFNKQRAGNLITDTDGGTSYDLKSVMHYSSTAFTRNGGFTIEVKANNQGVTTRTLGQRNGFSELDICGINKAYGCACEGDGNGGGGGGGGGGVTPVTTPPPANGGCPGTVQECKDIAGKGACEALLGLNLCAICQVQTSVCAKTCTDQTTEDTRSSCERWAAQGFCLNRFEAFMWTNCKTACGNRFQCRARPGSTILTIQA